MSEIKRAQLIPLGSQKEPDKSSKEPRKTIRISVVLPESTEDTCPEYNYKDELAAAKKIVKYKEVGGGGTVNGLSRLDEFGEDDDEVKRIARQMEEKYGTGASLNKKKRKGRKDDYADIGMGYDESDSFIDNTDGYDEMIPQNVTTLHGGFYINSGALEFKTDDEADSDLSSSSSDEEGTKKTVSRKRVIESSDETDREIKTETDEHQKKRKLQNGGNGVQQSIKKKLLSQNKIYIKKRRLLDPLKKTVKELLREKREDLDMSVLEDLKCDMEEDQKDKKNMSISNVTEVIESVVKASTEETKPVEVKNPESKQKDVVTVNSSSDGESSHDKAVHAKVETKLPENLSADILSVITAIRNAAEISNLDGKSNFSSEINLLILRLERKCKCLGKPSKMKVYEHLSVFLKCKTETLIKRAKILVFDDEQKKLRNLLTGLRTEINKIMPSLLESYEKESQRVIQKKFSQESVDNEDNKGLRMPKRRFQWNDITKKQLKDILMLKKRCLLLEGKSKDVLDTQMSTFLKTEIQVLWPDGWMSMNALNKIYTTYADPKRLNLSNGSSSQQPITSQSKPTTTTTTTTTMKNLPQSFNNNNLSITPIVAPPPKSESSTVSKLHSVSGEVSVCKTETSMNLSMKSLPETSQPCDINPTSPKREVEVKLKVKPPCELLKPPVSNHVNKKDSISLISDDSVIILDSTTRNDRFSPNKDKFHVKSEDNYCQVIDLSDKNDSKVKTEPKLLPKREKTISPISHVTKHHELSITPTYSKVEPQKSKSSSAGDDIQKVMENLKTLQKMSSPKKSVEPSPTSSAVSVIAVNKSFAPKSVHSESTTMQRYDYNKSEYSSSFQDEFQKQLFSALNQFSTNSNKSYNSIDRYPHISSSGPSMVAGDKYYQNSNNNYTQSSNGHKSSTSTQQSGTYTILDDMFANLLTQYGYSKEAAAPKSQPK